MCALGAPAVSGDPANNQCMLSALAAWQLVQSGAALAQGDMAARLLAVLHQAQETMQVCCSVELPVAWRLKTDRPA